MATGRSLKSTSGQRRYLAQAKYKLWPQAHLHTQWPGSGAPDDPVTLQMISGYLPEIEDFTKQQLLAYDVFLGSVVVVGGAFGIAAMVLARRSRFPRTDASNQEQAEQARKILNAISEV